jgi:glycosyltransferase involved in cell wall biosynthesis
MIKEIHLIIFSPLHNYDGGRETWLNLIIPELIRQLDGSIELFVYYYTDSDTDDERLIDAIKTFPSCFHAIPIRKGGGLFTNLARVLKYNFKVFKKITARRKGLAVKSSMVIGIGSFYEAIIPYLLSGRLFKRRFITAIWLRSILEKQLGAIRQSYHVKFRVGIERRMLGRMDFVIANGWDTGKYYKEHNKIDSVVIPNALDLSRFINIPDISAVDSEMCISFIGRLSPEKGFFVFLESILLFNERYPYMSGRIRFEVVGSGPLANELANRQYSNLIYKGVLSNEEIPDYLSQIDCGVALTSSSNIGGGGVSHGLLELLASGRIVIASDSFIYRQVADSTAIRYVAENSSNALVDAYLDILNNKRRYVEMAKRGRQVSSKFSIGSHVETFITKIIQASQ